MRKVLLIFLMIILCICRRESTDDSSYSDKDIKIDLFSKPESKVTKLSEIAADVMFVPLQTTKNSLIGSYTGKIVNTNNRFYIKNSGLDGEILCFDIKGKFLFKINKTGRGPQEYEFVSDFDISSDNKILTVLSSVNRKLMIYEISDSGFTFRRSIKLKDPAPYSISMVPETDNTFLAVPPWRGNERTLSLLVNALGDTIFFKPNCYKYTRQVNKEGFRFKEWIVYSTGNKVCFKEECSDTIFYVDAKNNSFKPRIVFDTHGTFYTPEMRGGSKKMSNSTTYIPNIFETSRYIFYWYYTVIVDQKIVNLYGFLFDRKAKTKHEFNINNDRKIVLKDDLCGGPDFILEFQDNNHYSGGKLFMPVDAITLKKYIASADFKNAHAGDPEKKAELKKLADSLQETDNPVLVMVTPKN